MIRITLLAIVVACTAVNQPSRSAIYDLMVATAHASADAATRGIAYGRAICGKPICL